MSQHKTPPTPEQLIALRAKVIADPNTRKIAESCEVPFEDYVEQVMMYLANPNLEPQINLMSDADLKAAGVPVPDMNEVAAFIGEYTAAREITTRSKFADPNSQRERVTGSIPMEPPATAKEEEVKGELKADLERERASGRFKKV